MRLALHIFPPLCSFLDIIFRNLALPHILLHYTIPPHLSSSSGSSSGEGTLQCYITNVVRWLYVDITISLEPTLLHLFGDIAYPKLPLTYSLGSSSSLVTPHITSASSFGNMDGIMNVFFSHSLCFAAIHKD